MARFVAQNHFFNNEVGRNGWNELRPSIAVAVAKRFVDVSLVKQMCVSVLVCLGKLSCLPVPIGQTPGQ